MGRCWFLVYWFFPRFSAASTVPPVRATAAGTSDLQDSIKNFTQRPLGRATELRHSGRHRPRLYDGAIPGMLRVLDPHSTFFDPRQYALLREDQRGKYYGVGMTVGPQDNHTVVSGARCPARPPRKRVFVPATSSQRWKASPPTG